MPQQHSLHGNAIVVKIRARRYPAPGHCAHLLRTAFGAHQGRIVFASREQANGMQPMSDRSFYIDRAARYNGA